MLTALTCDYPIALVILTTAPDVKAAVVPTSEQNAQSHVLHFAHEILVDSSVEFACHISVLELFIGIMSKIFLCYILLASRTGYMCHCIMQSKGKGKGRQFV